ncbi:MAG TPA: hypothetical protein VKA27_10400, partial [Sunxiuqinia sp.]|nr:hypothetical protein [Sunxiuqinia sp.]
GCHQPDYNNSTDPNHAAANFPTDCESCHTTNDWKPSTFNHDAQYFPIYSGKHSGRWSSCATCHTQPTNFAIFTCVTSSCHTRAHNQDQGSDGCYRCHPTGQGDD